VIDRRGRPIKKEPRSTQRTQSMVFSAIFAISAVSSFVACGKKGPPLPPLVKLPAAPADLAAARRGDIVDLSFTVPGVNTDGTRPANVASAEVYAITTPATVPPATDADLLKFGTKVGTVAVKAPRDPNLTADEDDPSDEVDAPEGPGLDQGAIARVKEPLTLEMLTPAAIPPDKHAPPPIAPRTDGPLLGPPPTVPVRTYAAFGTSARGKKGPLSRRVTVPLVPPPPPPTAPTIAYTETAVTVTWGGADAAPRAADAETTAASEGRLPSRAIGARVVTDAWIPVTAPPILPARLTLLTRPPIAYNIYDVTIPGASVRLNPKPLEAPHYADNRIVWGEKRCYVVVAAETIGGAAVESEAAPAACETLVDTFPPAAPNDLKAISSEGAINLIWEPNAEKDLAGYIVLRGVEPAETLQPITSAPIVEPSFRDAVQPGIAYAYAVRAVDKAGNSSPLSPRVVETAR
jgi:predicted small lipoprotein YifL